jgi:hypothetical protein
VADFLAVPVELTVVDGELSKPVPLAIMENVGARRDEESHRS